MTSSSSSFDSYVLLIYNQIYDTKHDTYRHSLANYPGLEVDRGSGLLASPTGFGEVHPSFYINLAKDINVHLELRGCTFFRAWHSNSACFVILMRPVPATLDTPPYTPTDSTVGFT